MKSVFATSALALAMIVAAATPASAQRSINGNWATDDGRAIVTISRCGGEVCGRLSRILVDTGGTIPRDENNPNRNLRNRSIQGITLIQGFTHRGNGSYRGGTIYDPESGRNYNARMQLNGDRLNVTGCVAFGTICQTQTWRRR